MVKVESPIIFLDSCAIDLRNGKVVRPDGEDTLSPHELGVLQLLWRRRGETVHRDVLLKEVWNYTAQGQTRVVDVVMRRLRTKVEEDPSRPRWIRTMHGDGYQIPQVADAEAATGEVIRLFDGHIDLSRHQVVRNDQTVPLTRIELDVLRALYEHPAELMPRDELITQVWGHKTGRTRVLDHAVRRLRSKIEVDPTKPKVLLSKRHLGVQLVVSHQESSPSPAPAHLWVASLLLPESNRDAVLSGLQEQAQHHTATVAGAHPQVLATTFPAWIRTVAKGAMGCGIAHGWVEHKEGEPVGGVVQLARALAKWCPSGHVVAAAKEPALGWSYRGDHFVVAATTMVPISVDPNGPALPPQTRPPTHNLPLRNPGFLGRTEVLQRLKDACEAQGGIITITGLGGSGKTALALELGHTLVEAGWSVRWCSLTGFNDRQGLLGQLNKAVGGTNVPNLGGLLASGGKRLLVLDNFEQLLPHAEALTGLCQQAPETRFVVSSRVALGTPLERQVTLGPLGPTEAIALVQQQGRQAGVVIDEPQAEQIAQQTDGWPLAIEIVAARTRLGTTGPPSVSRMGVLQALQWSWDQLGKTDRQLLPMLSIFEGQFDVDDALAVTQPDGPDPVAAIDDWMQGTWLMGVKGSLPLRLLVPVRQFLAEQMDETTTELACQLHMTQIRTVLASREKRDPCHDRLADAVRAMTHAAANHSPGLGDLVWLVSRHPAHLQRALSVAQEALDDGPDDVLLRYVLLAQRGTNDSTYDAKMATIQDQARQEGDHQLEAMAWSNRLHKCLYRGDQQAAAELVAAPPGSGDSYGRSLVLMGRATEALNRGAGREALEAFGSPSAQELRPLDEAAIAGAYGDLCMAMGELEQVESMYNKVLASDLPAWHRAQYMSSLAYLKWMQGQQAEAESVIAEAERLMDGVPSPSRILLNKADILCWANPKAAMEVVNLALDEAPKNEPTRTTFAQLSRMSVCMANNDRVGALQHVDALLEVGHKLLAWRPVFLPTIAEVLAWAEDPRAKEVLEQAEAAAEPWAPTPQAEISMRLTRARRLLPD